MYQQIRVAMPPGVRPGQVIQIRTPAGQVVQVSAPAGVPPGGTFMVNVPAAPVAPQQVQMTPVQQQYRPPPQQQQYRPPAAPAPYRPPPTRYQPITSQPNLVNTGSPIMRDYSSTPECTEGGCYKCVCCNCYSCCCCFCFTKRVAAVRQGEIGIIEKFGKFVRVAEPGEVLLDAPMGPCVPFETLQRTMNLRVRQQPVDTNTKTKDNVFVTIQVVVLYRIPDARMAQLAAYKLQDLKSQLNSFVDDTLRTTIAKVDGPSGTRLRDCPPALPCRVLGESGASGPTPRKSVGTVVVFAEFGLGARSRPTPQKSSKTVASSSLRRSTSTTSSPCRTSSRRPSRETRRRG